MLTILVSVNWYLIEFLVCFSLITNGVEYSVLFHIQVDHLHIVLVKCLFKSFVHFLKFDIYSGCVGARIIPHTHHIYQTLKNEQKT